MKSRIRPAFDCAWRWSGLSLLMVVLISGCARWPAPTRSIQPAGSGAVGACVDFFARLDRQTVLADAVDAGVFRIDGYPYLRMDRFLASLASRSDGPERFGAWVDRLQALDRMARRAEIASLPDDAVASLAGDGGRPLLFERIVACGDRLRSVEFRSPAHRQRLRREAVVPDEYIVARRWLGFYPVTREFVSLGVRRWHAEARKAHDEAPRIVPDAKWYAPPVVGDPHAAHQIVQRARTDALGIPDYTPDQRAALMRAHAPVWEIRHPGAADRIASPAWDSEGRLIVHTDQALTYTHLSFTHFGGAILTQLNYVIWFPGRPKTGPLDLYGGWLDGINLRVTLNRSGEPILYETIHNCGCYYKAFASDRLTPRVPVGYAEAPLIFKLRDRDAGPGRIIVALSAGIHEVLTLRRREASERQPSSLYNFAGYETLKQLPRADGGRRNMFDRFGLVPGSQRLERFILWSTGVLSPGAMREWGRHAVAFVGRRQFDDPFYLDRIFQPADVPPQSHGMTDRKRNGCAARR